MQEYEKANGERERRARERRAVEEMTRPIRRAIERADATREEKEDILQDVLIKILKKEGPTKHDNFEAWAGVVARNQVMDFYRCRRRREAIKMPLDCVDFVDKTQSEDREIAELDLARAIDRLKPGLKEVIWRVAEGASYNEIAAGMYLEVGTVRSRVFTARKQLKGILSYDEMN